MDFPEEINLEQMKVYAAPYGGPIAISRDPNQLRKAGPSNKPIIYIFSSSGNLISKINVRSLSSKLQTYLIELNIFSGTRGFF